MTKNKTKKNQLRKNKKVRQRGIKIGGNRQKERKRRWERQSGRKRRRWREEEGQKEREEAREKEWEENER